MSVLSDLELLEGWAALGGAMIPRAHARTITGRSGDRFGHSEVRGYLARR